MRKINSEMPEFIAPSPADDIMTLSHQIESDLQTHVARGSALPFRLTLQSMATHYRVSPQPVRTAVDRLLSQRWLVRDGSGRLQLNSKKKGKGTVRAIHAVAGRSDITAVLTERIIGHSLRGEAVFIREEETAEQLNVGRAVLRTALNRMNGGGLLDHVPRRGWRVRAYSEAQMLDYLEVRESLEVRAMDLARPRLDAKVLARLLQRNTPGKGGRLRIDNALHGYWIEQADNRYITDFFARHGRYYVALFDYAALAGSIVEEMATQHRTILEALIQTQWAPARRALRDHIRSQRPNVIRLMERAVET